MITFIMNRYLLILFLMLSIIYFIIYYKEKSYITYYKCKKYKIGKLLSSIFHNSYINRSIENSIDWDILKDYEYFVKMVNRRTLFQKGIVDSYNPTDPALGLEVEYFHPSITADDRMIYIME